jgi:predicted DNA-binding ArsR family transcriptional regulator
MKSLKTRLKNLTDNIPILIPVFVILWILGYLLRDTILTHLSIAFLSILFGIYLDNYKSKIKIRELKPAILLELRYILISLIENFTRFYVAYFAVIRLLKFDLKWFYELTEKYRKHFTDYLMNEIKLCMAIYENFGELKQEDIERTIKFLEKYIEELQLRSQWPTMEDVQRYFEEEKSRYRESKPSIKPIHMALLGSILNNLSALDKDFAEDIFYIWYEINELNKEIEVLKESLRMDPKLILSILKRTERIAIKIDEILEKEGTDL